MPRRAGTWPPDLPEAPRLPLAGPAGGLPEPPPLPAAAGRPPGPQLRPSWADSLDDTVVESGEQAGLAQEQGGTLNEVVDFVKERLEGFAYNDVKAQQDGAQLAMTVTADDSHCVKVGFAPALEPLLAETFGKKYGFHEVVLSGKAPEPRRGVQSAGRGA